MLILADMLKINVDFYNCLQTISLLLNCLYEPMNGLFILFNELNFNIYMNI